MIQILVYADSLSWGIIPNTRQRLAFAERWPGVFEALLNDAGQEARVVENCLNGRRTVWDDPLKAGRNGLQGLAQAVEMHSPLALVILMLGTNDFQSTDRHTAQDSANGMAALIGAVQKAPIEPGMQNPEILLVAPPRIVMPLGAMAQKFEGAERRNVGLAEELETVALQCGVHFFDAGSVTEASRVDGIHLDKDQHRLLGEKMGLMVMQKITL